MSERHIVWSVIETICGKPCLTSFEDHAAAVEQFQGLCTEQDIDEDRLVGFAYDNGFDYRVEIVEHELVTG